MFSRAIFATLDRWAEKKERKPLVLRGARQVGKTTAVNLWAERFDQYLYLNLDLPEDRKLFERDINVKELAESIFFQKNIIRGSSKVLLFIDEIQNSPKAVESLRYFFEHMQELYVIAAGSLLESLINRRITFPVGRVEYCMLWPLSFVEYLSATGEAAAVEALGQIPVQDYAHERLLKLFNRYTLIGGMPEIVRVYLEGNDLVRLKSVYNSLITAYLDDVEKYASNENQARVIRHVISNVFFEAGSRITFHGFGRSQYRSREISEAFALLEKALLISLVYPTTRVQIPAVPDRRKSPKLQLLDTGLIIFFAGLQAELIGTDSIDSVFSGKIAEHIVGQEILTSDPSPLHGLRFWVREKKQSNAEVDFVLPYEGKLIPVEVKTGATGRLRSLHQYMDSTDHRFAVRIYGGALRIDSVKTVAGKAFNLLNIPYYLAAQLNDYIRWFVDNAGVK